MEDEKKKLQQEKKSKDENSKQVDQEQLDVETMEKKGKSYTPEHLRSMYSCGY